MQQSAYSGKQHKPRLNIRSRWSTSFSSLSRVTPRNSEVQFLFVLSHELSFPYSESHESIHILLGVTS
eukprot:753553-Hanusia_phi.AAC.1